MRKFKLYLKVDRRELNSIPNLCKILPKSIKQRPRSDPNASLERFRSQVATRSVSGWSPLNYRITPFRAPWTKNVIQVRAFGRPWIQNGSQTHLFSIGWYLDTPKMLSEREIGQKHVQIMKFRCENLMFSLAQNHVWRYTLRL